MAPSPSIHHLLKEHQSLSSRCNQAIEQQLDEFYAQTEAGLAAIWHEEQRWLPDRMELRDEIASLLEADARCLLTTKEFRAFVPHLLSACQNMPRLPHPPLVLDVDPVLWWLRELQFPLQLKHYHLVQEPGSYRYRYTITLEEWQGTVEVLIATQGHPTRRYAIERVEQQWAHLLTQLRFEPLDRTGDDRSAEATQLRQEIGAVVCYVT